MTVKQICTSRLCFLLIFLLQADRHEHVFQEQGIYTYKDRWLFVLNSETELLPLQHVAGNVIHVTAVFPGVNETEVFNAFYQSHGREFGKINEVSNETSSSSLTLKLQEDSLFPNAKFKFNGRKFRHGINYVSASFSL